jgi:hypothetical protein
LYESECIMPDANVLGMLDAYRRRFRLASLAAGLVIASAAAGAVVGGGALTSLSASATRVAASATFLVVTILVALTVRRVWTLPRVARLVEARHGGFDNLLITAEEIAGGRTPELHPSIREAVLVAALERLRLTQPTRVQPLVRPVALGATSFAVFAALLAAVPDGSAYHAAAPDRPRGAPVLAPGDVRVVVTPPSYTSRPAVDHLNPASVTALEMSRVRLEVIEPAGDVSLVGRDGGETRFVPEGEHASLDLTATSSRPLVVRQRNPSGTAADRLVHLRVDRDERPVVSMRDPGKDLMFPEGTGQVSVAIEARDDVGLTSLRLLYTRVSGSGETFTFEEGEWPIEITRENGSTWRGRGILALQRLNLQDGDTLVYRAVARDANPNADPASSDTYLIEVGRLAGIASTGFALPEERDRQAISQQMLIIKTERLHSEKDKLTPESFREQAQLLAVEQRMVKAEFVFMTGGEVEDEVEEATHAHELAEGRLENSGQVELLTAIREMSRAEARLNAAETAAALEFERAALKALQRAFDRRRYLLRTLPERARIDLTRRLTGELQTARSSTSSHDTSTSDADAAQAREVLGELSAARNNSSNLTKIASRMLAVAPTDAGIQKAALRLSVVRDANGREAAIREAQDAMLGFLRERLPASVRLPLQRDVLKGRVAAELQQQGDRQ